VIGSDDDMSRIAEQLTFEDRQEPKQILEVAQGLQHPQSLFDLRADEAARWQEYLKSHPELDMDGAAGNEEPLGSWPSQPPGETALEVAKDVLSGKPYDRVHILIIPTTEGFEVPAYLNWGGWNECPPPEIHVAALRKWHEEFGAELIGLSGDVMNLRVERRPRTRDEAIKLAREQYKYYADIVDQGMNDISTLAAGLYASNWWYFWWD